MVFFFTALQEQKKIKVFSFQPGQLELGLDFINIVSAQGNSILSAHIVDENGATELPLEIFDGMPFSAPMQSLEKQWKKVLKKPLKQDTQEPVIDTPTGRFKRGNDLSQHTKERIDMLDKQIQIYKKYITNLDSTINQFKDLVCQANQIGNFDKSKHYKMLIHKNKERIAKAQNKLKLCLDKLHQFQHDYKH